MFSPSARSVSPGEVSALDHEVGDDAVELGTRVSLTFNFLYQTEIMKKIVLIHDWIEDIGSV